MKNHTNDIEIQNLELLSQKYSITIGAKVPSSIPYAMGNAEITYSVSENEEFDKALEKIKDMLQEALSVALITAEQAAINK